MSIRNLDELKAKKDELLSAIADSVRRNDDNAMKNAMENWQNFVSDEIMSKVSSTVESVDRSILAGRGVRQLTSREIKYYDSIIANAKGDAGNAFNEQLFGTIPETVIDAVISDMKQEHPLLDFIDFTNTSAAIKWVLNAQGSQSATWDELNTEITKKLSGAIEITDMTFCKLTAYMFVTRDMLELGPVWVDAYCRTTLSEALSAGLETAIVDGDGVKKPIGMTRAFTSAFDPSAGYARKTPVSVVSFTPSAYGSLLDTLTTDRNGHKRAVSRVMLVCNPSDYMTKIMPATTLLTPSGVYAKDVLPFPTDVVQSVGVPEGHAVLGIAKNYFMGLGTSKGGKLEYSDEYKFLEDLRTYVIRLYGNGRPKDINSFVYLDISGLEPLEYSVAASSD